MKGVSLISFDFNRMEVSFEKEGKRMTITGGREARMCKLITGKGLRRVMKGKWAQWAQLFSIVANEDTLEEQGGLGQTHLTIRRFSSVADCQVSLPKPPLFLECVS